MNDFVAWFQNNGGVLDTSMMGITDFPGSGRGAVALQDIPVRRSPSNNFCLDWLLTYTFLRKTIQFSRFLVH